MLLVDGIHHIQKHNPHKLTNRITVFNDWDDMNNPTLCIIDNNFALNEAFYKRLAARMAHEGITINYCKELGDAAIGADAWLLAAPVDMEGVERRQIVLGLRTINRKERMEVAKQILPENLIARWASPDNELKLTEVLRRWGRAEYVFKYDCSAGRRGVKLLYHGLNPLPADYASGRDIVMEYLDDDTYTYKAELCCGVLLNAWFLRTVSITADNFNAHTGHPAQYTLPGEVRAQLEKLSTKLMQYGCGYISIDMMKYEGEFKVIEINTNAVATNISWQHFGETYLATYPDGIKRLLANLAILPTLGDLKDLRQQANEILSSSNHLKTVSVIIAAYRAADFIHDAIHSVLAQQLPANYRLQLILGIDGCESTREAVSGIQDERLQVLNMDRNYGTYITFNTMMRFVTGALVVRFDADDLMLDGYLSKQIEVFEQQSDVCLTWTRSRYIDTMGRGIRDEAKDGATALADWEIRSEAEGQFMFRKRIWPDLGGFRAWRCNSDTDFLIRLRFLGYKEYGIQEVLYLRRIHPGSLTQCEATGYDSELRRGIREIIKHEWRIRTTKEECWIDPTVGGVLEASGQHLQD
jgi:hypothetical protein